VTASGGSSTAPIAKTRLQRDRHGCPDVRTAPLTVPIWTEVRSGDFGAFVHLGQGEASCRALTTFPTTVLCRFSGFSLRYLMTIRVACLAMGAVGGTDLGRLDSHVPDASAGRCAAAFDGLAADYPTHRGIVSQPVCVIHIFISGETTIDGLAQQTDDPVPAVLEVVRFV
jgi:hypothetical protein